MEFNIDVFKQFDKKWALLTAGDDKNFNTMTISWGGLGTLFNKPVATVYVRKSRYTHEFLDKNEYFTISFFDEEYKKTLGILGAKSGRDIDKINNSGLTPKRCGDSTTFAEACVTLLCKKLFCDELKVDKLPADIREAMYSNNPPHDMYIGEVVDIIK